DTVSQNFDDGNNDYRSTTPNPAWPDPEHAKVGDYYVSIGQPGGFAATEDGFCDACDLYQRKPTWRADLGAAEANKFIRQKFGMAEPDASVAVRAPRARFLMQYHAQAA